jgi:HEPN domain-containing protein
MTRTSFCNECKKYVHVTDNGRCEFGHKAKSLFPVDIEHAILEADRFAKAAVCMANFMSGIRLSLDFKPLDPLPFVLMDGNCGSAYLPVCLKDPEMDFLDPYVVNAAFSLELYLKVLLYFEKNIWRDNTHNLKRLFDELPKDSKTKINNDFLVLCLCLSDSRDIIRKETPFKKFDWNLNELLLNSSNAFEAYRYAFEKKQGWFAGFWELRTALINRIDELRKPGTDTD